MMGKKVTAEEMIDRVTNEFPIHQWGCIDTAQIVFHPEVREICQGNACGCYDKTWTCPPGVGSYEECKATCLSYEKAFVFTGKYELEDSYDFEGMMDAKDCFMDMCRQIRTLWRESVGTCTLYGNGGCKLCDSCTYPDAPCRFPDQSILSLEGMGILVNRLAETAGVNYINGKDTVTYFAAVFY